MTDNTESELKHYSDCATHNEPAYPNGPCDCGGYYSEAWPQELLEWAEQTGAINPHVSWYSELTHIITKAVAEARKQKRGEIVEMVKGMKVISSCYDNQYAEEQRCPDCGAKEADYHLGTCNTIKKVYLEEFKSDIIQNLTNKE